MYWVMVLDAGPGATTVTYVECGHASVAVISAVAVLVRVSVRVVVVG
jgi:hypothetical protein